MTDRSLDLLSRSSPRSGSIGHQSLPEASRSQFPAFTGFGFLAGIAPGLVTVNAIPAARNLKLFTRYGGLLLRNVRSASDGSYQFNQLDENQIFQILGQDDSIPPFYQAVIRDFLVPVVAVTSLWRDGTTARAICTQNFIQGTAIRILHADQSAWNNDFTISTARPGWFEFTVSASLPANPTGNILVQRKY